MNTNCDLCTKSVKITPTVNHKVQKDGLIILCKSCWTRKGMTRDRFSGQIQNGYYLTP